MSAGKLPCLVRRVGGQVVVTLPEHISVSNADAIRAQLLAGVDDAAEELVADMTATLSCDHAGADAVMAAYEHSIISGRQLRLAVADPVLCRGLAISGLTQLIPTYSSVEDARTVDIRRPQIGRQAGDFRVS